MLTATDLSSSRLTDADLRDVDARGARFSGAELGAADLSRGNFSQADFSAAALPRAWLRDAILVGARSNGARLTGARFPHADAGGADFTGADLDGARVDRRCRFWGARFDGARRTPRFRRRVAELNRLESWRQGGWPGRALYHAWNVAAGWGWKPFRLGGHVALITAVFALAYSRFPPEALGRAGTAWDARALVGFSFRQLAGLGLIGAGVSGPAAAWLLAEAVLGLMAWAAFLTVLARGWDAVNPRE